MKIFLTAINAKYIHSNLAVYNLKSCSGEYSHNVVIKEYTINQIQDDILDVTGNQEVLGKPVGSDAKNEKATYVTYEGLKKAQEDVKRYSKHAVNLLESLVVKNEFLIHLVEYLIHREK